MKYLFLIFGTFLLVSCSVFIQTYGIKLKSLNNSWAVSEDILSINDLETSFNIEYLKKDFLLKISISNFKSTIKTVESIYAPIPMKESRNTGDNCENIFNLNFSTNAKIKGKIHKNYKYEIIFAEPSLNELKKIVSQNTIQFNPDKIFIIKNNVKYNVTLVNGEYPDIYWNGKKYRIYKDENNLLNISENMLINLNRLTQKDNYNTVVHIGKFISPFGCQALEGTILVVDGIYLNGKKVEPIEIKLSYKNSTNYDNYFYD